MLILSRKVNERIMIGDRIELSIVEIRGDHVKLGIDAPQDVKVYRQEVYEAIQAENRAAVNIGIDLPAIDAFIESGASDASVEHSKRTDNKSVGSEDSGSKPAATDSDA